MLYEMFWLFYALMIVILVSVGLWGIFFFASIQGLGFTVRMEYGEGFLLHEGPAIMYE